MDRLQNRVDDLTSRDWVCGTANFQQNTAAIFHHALVNPMYDDSRTVLLSLTPFKGEYIKTATTCYACHLLGVELLQIMTAHLRAESDLADAMFVAKDAALAHETNAHSALSALVHGSRPAKLY